MGQDKASMELQGRPFWYWLDARFRQHGFATYLLSRHAAHQVLDIPCIAENRPNKGPLAGLEVALQTSRAPFLFLLSCDMPLLPFWALELLYLHHLQRSAPVVVLQIAGRPCPTVGFYAQQILPTVKRALDAERLALMPLLQEVEALTVEVSGDPRYQAAEFLNVNTVEQWLQLNAYTEKNRIKW